MATAQKRTDRPAHKCIEFFAGGGMARAGLGARWHCTFANEIDGKKAEAYTRNWGADSLLVRDVALVKPADVPAVADLAWASFPCQDLSLAGAGAGLSGDRSGTFWPFWHLMMGLRKDGRAPKLIVLENVCGALTSHEGRDFAQIGKALAQGGYQFGALVVDAIAFLPHSRPRLFIIGVQDGARIPAKLIEGKPSDTWHPQALIDAHRKLDKATAAKWVWWSLPIPPACTVTLADILEDEPQGVTWHTKEETARLIGMMSDVNLAKMKRAQRSGRRVVGCVYKRTRPDETGRKVQRAEIRFDDVAGCLRTPGGGSSRQVIVVVDGNVVRSRLISPRETARLMGLPEAYVLPEKYNDAYHLTGDGVAVPVVRYLAARIFEPILKAATQ